MSQQNPVPPPDLAEGKLRGFDLTDRRVIVYGAEKPVATAIVDALREAGAAVGVTSANTDGTSLFRLKKAGGSGPTEAVELANGTNVQVATRKISKELGGVDAAIVVPNLYHAAPIPQDARRRHPTGADGQPGRDVCRIPQRDPGVSGTSGTADRGAGRFGGAGV